MIKIIKIVLKKQKYLYSSLFAGFLMFALSYYLTIVNIIHKNLLSFADMNGYWFTIFTIFFSLVISILFGIYISLLIFKNDIKKKARNIKDKASGFGGATFGILASGCPSCGAPLLGLLGFPLGLFMLPFRGLEIKLLGIVLLFISLYLITKNIKESLFCETTKNNE